MDEAVEPSLQAAAALRRGTIRLSRRLRVERAEDGVAGSALNVLAHLHLRGAMAAGELAAADRVKPQSVTRVLNELQAAGLVVRRPGEIDRRQSLVQITPAGLDVLREDARQRDAWLAAAMATALSSTERDLLRLAGELMERLADAPSGGPR